MNLVDWAVIPPASCIGLVIASLFLLRGVQYLIGVRPHESSALFSINSIHFLMLLILTSEILPKGEIA